MSGELKESPMRDVHLELGARMVGFAGWNMPIRYGSILEEHRAVREKAGVFDISHMGQFLVHGKKAEEWLDSQLTNHVGGLEDGEAHYTFLLNEEGGVIDDLILYRFAEDQFLMVVNAARIQEDFRWLSTRRDGGVEIEDKSESYAGMAVQGRLAPEVYSRMTGGRTLPPRNALDRFEFEGQPVIVCRTGYTGEDGFELFCLAKGGAHWFRSALDSGAAPCGLGARDSLRLEMCYPLNGSDLSPERTPLEAGLGFFVDLDKGAFTGREVLARQKAEGCAERLVALQCSEPGPPIRSGSTVRQADGEELGKLSSGTLSPCLGVGIGLAYLPRDSAKIGTKLAIEVRGRQIAAEVVKKPFYKKS